MRTTNWMLLAAATLCGSMSLAAGDTPAVAAPVPSPPYGLAIGLAQARQMAAAVNAAAAKANETDVVIAITDTSGALVYFEKMDDATYLSIQLAQNKAIMAARYRMASGDLPPSGAVGLPDAIGLKGGLPIVYQGKTIGAIGVSGADANDVPFAELAIAALTRAAR